ncbi:MAG: UXX-star (seleno)protein family 2 [Dehalococcoidia bacterium]
MSESIVLYTHPDCSYSDALKEELTDLALDFEEINLALKPELWGKVEELTGGERITPVMVTGDNVEVGFHGVG